MGYNKKTDENHKGAAAEFRAVMPEATLHDVSGAGRGFPDFVVGWKGMLSNSNKAVSLPYPNHVEVSALVPAENFCADSMMTTGRSISRSILRTTHTFVELRRSNFMVGIGSRMMSPPSADKAATPPASPGSIPM